MKTEHKNVKIFTDTWGGKNYGCYPINTPGQSLKESLDNSKLWKLVSEKQQIDERNDNQCDIHRSSDFSYESCVTDNIINIYMSRSRSGKTIDWMFKYNFDGGIDL
jgi:hypothetical protein